MNPFYIRQAIFDHLASNWSLCNMKERDGDISIPYIEIEYLPVGTYPIEIKGASSSLGLFKVGVFTKMGHEGRGQGLYFGGELVEMFRNKTIDEVMCGSEGRDPWTEWNGIDEDLQASHHTVNIPVQTILGR